MLATHDLLSVASAGRQYSWPISVSCPKIDSLAPFEPQAVRWRTGGWSMGTFFADAVLASTARPEYQQPIKLLVDSGSTYTWVSAAILRALSVVPTERRRVVTIDGQVTERDAAEVLITLEGRTLHTLCLFAEARDLDVLGAYTLEGFGLGIDPVQRKLIPALQYGAAAG